MGNFKVPRAYVALLVALLDAGKGVGKLDQFGRVTVGPTKDLLPGDAVSWLLLCSYGCIEGRQDKPGELEITPLGKAEVEEYRGKTRVA